MDRSRRRVSLPDKENLPPPGAGSVASQRKIKPKKRPLQASVLASLALEPRSKKVKSNTVRVIATARNFLALPYDVLDRLLGYLDVKSMKALGRTCSQMDLLINGRYLTSVELPFPKRGSFMKAIDSSEVIEKKPVLKVLCPRALDHEGVWKRKYQLDTHLRLLSLKRVREVDLLPSKIPEVPMNRFHMNWFDKEAEEYERIILDRLSNLGALRNISRLSIMFSNVTQGQYLESIMPAMTNLLELDLFASVVSHIADYASLKKIIAATKAYKVYVTIKASPGPTVSEQPKVLQNDHIERLHVSAHCSLNIHLKMKSLKELTLELTEWGLFSCSYPRSRYDDRKIHRAGRCVVDIASVYGNCPSLVNFNGLNIGHVPQSLEFNKWSNRVKKIAYQDYLSSGGKKEMKKWAGTRWFKKKPEIPDA